MPDVIKLRMLRCCYLGFSEWVNLITFILQKQRIFLAVFREGDVTKEDRSERCYLVDFEDRGVRPHAK